MKKNKKSLLLSIPLAVPMIAMAINNIKTNNMIKANEISNYMLATTANNVEDVVAAIKKKLKDKKIKFYNIDDWNNLTDTKNIVLTQIVNIIKDGTIFSNGAILVFDELQLEIQKINYNASNQQVDLVLSYYKRDFKVSILLDNQLVNSDYIIAITERIKQLDVNKKMTMFQKPGENINKIIKSEIYQWINENLTNVDFKLNDQKIDVDLKLLSLLAFKNKVEKEEKIIATIDYKNFSEKIDLPSQIINTEKFQETLQNKINTLKIIIDESINYANVFEDLSMKLIIKKIINLLGDSIEIDEFKVILNVDNFDPSTLNEQDKNELNPWIQKFNFKFRHKKSNLDFNSIINFTYNKTDKENLFTSVFQNKINSNFELTSGNDLLFLNLNNLKSLILSRLKDNLDNDFSGGNYKFTFDYQQLNIYDYKIFKEDDKIFVKIFFKYGQIITSDEKYIKIPVNTTKKYYYDNFEKIYKLIQKQISVYPKETELRPDVNPAKAIEWISSKIKSNVKSIKINETNTEIEWEKFTFGVNSNLPVHVKIDEVNYFAFTLSYKDLRYGVEFTESFYIYSPYQETTPNEIIYGFSKKIYKDMQTYFNSIHQTIIDNSNFKALEERFKKLVPPLSSNEEEWKIMNFFGYLTNIYLDFLGEIISKLMNPSYNILVYANLKSTADSAINRFKTKMELLLKDYLKKVSEILNNSAYQKLFDEIDWVNSLKGGDSKNFFDKIYILNNNLIKDTIKYILK